MIIKRLLNSLIFFNILLLNTLVCKSQDDNNQSNIQPNKQVTSSALAGAQIKPLDSTVLRSYIGDYSSHTRNGNIITISSGSDKVKVVICDQSLIRVILGPGGYFETDESYAVIKYNWPAVSYILEDNADELMVITDDLRVRINKHPIRFAYYDKNKKLLARDLNGLGYQNKSVFCRMELNVSDHFFGLGDRKNALDKRGRKIINWNKDGYNVKDGMEYHTETFFFNSRGYGLFFDNSWKTEFDLGATSSEYFEFKAPGGELDYYFIAGDPGKIFDRHTELTGRPYMPPKWAMGYQQSKWSYNTRSELENVAATFRNKNIPCDVLWLDGPNSGWWRNNINFCGQFDNRYPDPPGMIAGLGNKGFKLCLLENQTMDTVSRYYTDGQPYYVKNPNGSVWIARQWNGKCGVMDFSSPGAGEWWSSLHHGLWDMGIAGFWIDMNDGGLSDNIAKGVTDKLFSDGKSGAALHNPSGGLLGIQSLHNGMKNYTKKRPYILSRGGFPGMARAGWTWSADLRFESWEDLARQLRMEQSMSVCSIVYGSDVGGCTAPLKENGQAYLRWLQAGCFNFLTRSHCAGVDKHPWNYGSTIEAFAKKILEWKYMLLPYIYTAAYEMHQTGYPLHRPLVLSYPSDSSVYNKADEFMFGDWMLIAPVINGNNDTGNSDTARNIYLPAGTWVDYKDGKTIYKGPLTLNNYSAPLDIVPIFVKAGAIIPMQPVMEYVGQRPIDLLTLDIYPAGYSSYIMYEDDEETYDYLNGAYCKTKYECVESGTIVKVKINSRVGSYTPDNRDYMLKVHNRTGGILDVKLNGTSLPQTTYSALSGGSKGYAPDADKKLVWVRIDDTGVEMSVEIMYKN